MNIDKHGSQYFPSTHMNLDAGRLLGPGHSGLQVNPASSQNTAEAREQLVRAGRQFEAYFVSYLLKVMRETVPEGTVANKQGAYFYSFYDEEIGKRAAESGGIGITKMVQEYAEKNVSLSQVGHSSSSE